MNDILNGLASEPTQGEELPPQIHPLVSDLTSGKLKGVFVPKGFNSEEATALAPDLQSIQKLGLAVYQPKHDTDVELVVANPAKVSLKQVQKADEKGELNKLFKPITDYFAASAPPSEEAAPDTAGPSPGMIPVMPKATFGAGAQKAVAAQRTRALSPKTPTQRQLPGAGTLLNGLLQRSV